MTDWFEYLFICKER